MFQEAWRLFQATWRRALYVWVTLFVWELITFSLPPLVWWLGLLQKVGWVMLLVGPPVLEYVQMAMASAPYYHDARPLRLVVGNGIRYWIPLAVLSLIGWGVTMLLSMPFRWLGLRGVLNTAAMTVLAPLLFAYGTFSILNVIRRGMRPVEGIQAALPLVPKEKWAGTVGAVSCLSILLTCLNLLIYGGRNTVLYHVLVPAARPAQVTLLLILDRLVDSAIQMPLRWYLLLCLVSVWRDSQTTGSLTDGVSSGA